MDNLFYLYCNSEASSHKRKTGLVKTVVYVKTKQHGTRKLAKNTTEFAFAKEFKTYEEAEAYTNKHGFPAIIFQRKDL